MSYYPIFLSLEHQEILVIGAGKVAYRKIRELLKANAKITVLSPQISPEIQTLLKTTSITYIAGNYDLSYMTPEIRLVFACTDKKEVNAQIACDAQKAHIFVNVIDDISICDFITPAVIEKKQVQVAFSSSGASPSLMRYLRRKFKKQLPEDISELAHFAQIHRREAKKHLPDPKKRQLFWDCFFNKAEGLSNQQELSQLFTQLIANFVNSE